MPNPQSRAPIIILIQPQLGENIGAAARAMMNFGLTELRLVAPRDGWPNEKAYKMAATATGILDKVKLFDTTEDAISDVQVVYASTSRTRDMVKRMIDPVKAAMEMHERIAAKQRVAILFGPERTGLVNEDIALSDTVVTIPTDPDNASLNVAQSVVILGYEWFKPLAERYRGRTPTTSARASTVDHLGRFEPATRSEIQGFFDHLEETLDRADFFKSLDKKPKMWLNIRNLFIRAGLSGQDVRTLRGILREITRRR